MSVLREASALQAEVEKSISVFMSRHIILEENLPFLWRTAFFSLPDIQSVRSTP